MKLWKLGDEREMLYQVTKGLAYLHGKGIIHRDIKPSNILIYIPENGKPHLKLADFGICSTLIKDTREIMKREDKNPYGTQGWIAPELFDSEDCDFPVDIFALGCIFAYTLTIGGKHPFGAKPLEQYIRILDKETMLLHLDDFKKPYSSGRMEFELIEWMVKIDPKARPEIGAVLQHSFFFNCDRGNYKLIALSFPFIFNEYSVVYSRSTSIQRLN